MMSIWRWGSGGGQRSKVKVEVSARPPAQAHTRARAGGVGVVMCRERGCRYTAAGTGRPFWEGEGARRKGSQRQPG